MEISRNSPVPLYLQIKQYILAKIQSGEYPRNVQLPSERRLADQFQVNRLTVTKALKDLEQEGFVYTQVGKGTFVKDEPISQEIAVLSSFTEEMTLRGQTVYSKVITAKVSSPSEETARILQILPGEHVVILERVRYAGNRPMALEHSSFRAAHCPGILERYDFSRQSLYAALGSDYGINLAYAEQTFEARGALTHEARRLSVTEGAPVLAIHRITFTQDDRPFEVVNSVYQGDRYKFRAILRRITSDS